MIATVLTLAMTTYCERFDPFADQIRVGEIRLSDNVVTKSRAIRNALDDDLCNGQRMPSEADRLKIEIRLLMKFHKRFDLDAGKRPQIVVLPDPMSRYWDVEVRFPEKAKE